MNGAREHPCFSDAALVLVGHGSTRMAESSAPVYQHAAELRRRGLFAQVLECFWKAKPGIVAVLHGVVAPRVFIVPVFISEGYFTEEAIPRAVGLRVGRRTDWPRRQHRDNRTLYYCGPVGTHDSMTAVLLARAREIVAHHPFPRAPGPQETALVIVGHGTTRNENSRRPVERQVDLIRSLGEYAEVRAAFLEEEPRLAEVLRATQAPYLVVVPFFISDGQHTRQDIPVLLGEPERVVQARLRDRQPPWRNPTERGGKLLWYAPAVGTEPRLAEVILERVEEAFATA